MGLVTPFNPYTGTPKLVDDMIGDAYDVVKHVYDNMVPIYAVAAAVLPSTIGQPFLAQRAILQSGASGTKGGPAVVIDFEDLDIVSANILASHVSIVGNVTGTRYFYDSGIFTAKVTNLGLSVSLLSSAPVECELAILHWFMVYGGI